MQEFIQGFSFEQLVGLVVGIMGAILALVAILFKVVSFVINTLFRDVRSNTEWRNRSDVERATYRATTQSEIRHLHATDENHETRITDLERK